MPLNQRLSFSLRSWWGTCSSGWGGVFRLGCWSEAARLRSPPSCRCPCRTAPPLGTTTWRLPRHRPLGDWRTCWAASLRTRCGEEWPWNQLMVGSYETERECKVNSELEVRNCCNTNKNFYWKSKRLFWCIQYKVQVRLVTGGLFLYIRKGECQQTRI